MVLGFWRIGELLLIALAIISAFMIPESAEAARGALLFLAGGMVLGVIWNYVRDGFQKRRTGKMNRDASP